MSWCQWEMGIFCFSGVMKRGKQLNSKFLWNVSHALWPNPDVVLTGSSLEVHPKVVDVGWFQLLNNWSLKIEMCPHLGRDQKASEEAFWKYLSTTFLSLTTVFYFLNWSSTDMGKFEYGKRLLVLKKILRFQKLFENTTFKKKLANNFENLLA